jgi:serine/threonine protein kinase
MSTDIDLDDLILLRENAVGQAEAPSNYELSFDFGRFEEMLATEHSTEEFGREGSVGVADSNPSSRRDVPGRLLADAEPVPGYRLVARVGEGSTGEVWKAIGPGGFPVAMKFVRVSEEADPSPTIQRRRRNNLRSLELMREVRHPNLLPLFGAWLHDGLLVLVMELADRTLQDQLREARRRGMPGIPVSELLEYMWQAAAGIDHLNEPRHTLFGRSGAGIQHRDIKPQNLLLIGGCVKVGDFGQAKLLEDEVHNTGCLTAAYAPPELFQGLMSRQSDQYSMAITYCELRGGRLPFVGNPLQTMMGHFQGTPDLSMIPEAERAVVARALAKRPAERWPDCRAFVNAVKDSLASAEDGIRNPFRPLALAPQPGERQPGRILTGALGFAILATLSLAAPFLRIARVTEPAPNSVHQKGPVDPISRAVRPTPPHVPAPLIPTPTIPNATPTRFPSNPPLSEVRREISPDPVGKTQLGENPLTPEPHARDTALKVSPAPERRRTGSTIAAVEVFSSVGVSKEVRSVDKSEWTVDRLDKVWVKTADPRPSRPTKDPAVSSQPRVRPAIATQLRAAADRPKTTKRVANSATLHVLLPTEKAELVVEGGVERGNPDEWYGPARVIHSPAMDKEAEYRVGAFWLDADGRPLTRSCAVRVEPGKVYEVDLRSAQPSSKEIPRLSTSGEPNL